jgi:hypothetical protein
MQYWLKDMEYKLQLSNELVDISNWEGEEESFVYPVGAREKKLLYCPSYSSLNFLEPGHRYLFKLSAKRCPEQFWIEIFAYRLGFRMEVDVPPAFVAFDSKSNQFGALSRWFLEDSASDQKIKIEKFESGGDILQGHLHNFDRKKGGKHNFLTIAQIFERDFLNLNKEWRQSWAKIFIFDALIGNTDRHQDNWGLISGLDEKKRISPAFDNGTSMGYEIKEDKFDFRTSHEMAIIRYITRSTYRFFIKICCPISGNKNYHDGISKNNQSRNFPRNFDGIN